MQSEDKRWSNINPIMHHGYISQATPEQVKNLIDRLECDPHGRKAGEGGSKLDDGKIMGGILADFNLALLAVAQVGTFGAKKYSRGGWLTVPNGLERYDDAMWRHLLAKGDYDNGIGGIGTLHRAQVCWNALAGLQYVLRDNDIPWVVDVKS